MFGLENYKKKKHNAVACISLSYTYTVIGLQLPNLKKTLKYIDIGQ